MKLARTAILLALMAAPAAASASTVTFDFDLPSGPFATFGGPAPLGLVTTASNSADVQSGYNVVNGLENGYSVLGVRDNYINIGEYLWTNFSEEIELNSFRAVRVKESEHVALFTDSRSLIKDTDFSEGPVLPGGIREITFLRPISTRVLGVSTFGSNNNGISLDSITVALRGSTNAVVPLPTSAASGGALLTLLAAGRRRR